MDQLFHSTIARCEALLGHALPLDNSTRELLLSFDEPCKLPNIPIEESIRRIYHVIALQELPDRYDSADWYERRFRAITNVLTSGTTEDPAAAKQCFFKLCQIYLPLAVEFRLFYENSFTSFQRTLKALLANGAWNPTDNNSLFQLLFSIEVDDVKYTVEDLFDVGIQLVEPLIFVDVTEIASDYIEKLAELLERGGCAVIAQEAHRENGRPNKFLDSRINEVNWMAQLLRANKFDIPKQIYEAIQASMEDALESESQWLKHDTDLYAHNVVPSDQSSIHNTLEAMAAYAENHPLSIAPNKFEAIATWYESIIRINWEIYLPSLVHARSLGVPIDYAAMSHEISEQLHTPDLEDHGRVLETAIWMLNADFPVDRDVVADLFYRKVRAGKFSSANCINILFDRALVDPRMAMDALLASNDRSNSTLIRRVVKANPGLEEELLFRLPKMDVLDLVDILEELPHISNKQRFGDLCLKVFEQEAGCPDM